MTPGKVGGIGVAQAVDREFLLDATVQPCCPQGCLHAAGVHRCAGDAHDDLVTTLIQAEVDGDHLSSVEYANMFQVLVFAGNETTRTAISNGLKAFIDNPDQLDLLYARPELVENAVTIAPLMRVKYRMGLSFITNFRINDRFTNMWKSSANITTNT